MTTIDIVATPRTLTPARRRRASATRAAPAVVAVLAGLLGAVGCTSTYYRVLETVGIEKRDILVDRVEDARDAQSEAKEQFSSALEQYRSIVDVDAGELEEVYDRLNAEYERSVDRADAVRERIDAVESVANDLFDEWESELDEYSNPGLRRQSRELLAQTRTEYERLLRAMHRAERSMDPVLTLFNDQVLALRHNLNARAIGALQTELGSIERATATLVDEMEQAIDEASRFLESLE